MGPIVNISALAKVRAWSQSDGKVLPISMMILLTVDHMLPEVSHYSKIKDNDAWAVAN